MAVDDANRETAEHGGFDPRYDPAFQRGYRPQPGERATQRPAAQRPPVQRPPAQRPPVQRDEPTPITEAPSSRAVAAPASWETDVERDRIAAETAAGSYGAVPDGVPGVPATPEATLDSAPLLTSGQAARGGFLESIDFSPRRNRAVLTLWIVGGGLVALGIILYVMSVFTSYTNPTSGADVTGLVFSQLGWMLAGPLITVGLATLVVLLGLTLLASRRPPAIDSEVVPATRRPEA